MICSNCCVIVGAQCQKNLYKSKMTLEVVDIVERSAAAGQEEESDTMEPPVKEEAAPKRHGRPPGSRDKQPRQRVPRVPAAMETEDIEEAPQSVLKREGRRTTTLQRFCEAARPGCRGKRLAGEREHRRTDAAPVSSHAAPPRVDRVSATEGISRPGSSKSLRSALRPNACVR